MNYDRIIEGIINGLVKMKNPHVSLEEFYQRLDNFKNFDYKKLSDDEIFWRLTYVLFFNRRIPASTIEKKLPLLRKYLYGVEKLSHLNSKQIEDIINHIGFSEVVRWCVENSKLFYSLINKYGSFNNYLKEEFNIIDTSCSEEQLQKLYLALKKNFKGIGKSAGWHFLTELGFFTLKPDKVIRRIFYRIGLIEDENDLDATIAVGREISKQLNIPIRYIDIIFVKYGQVGQSDLLGTIDGICTENNPKCNICELKSICRYYKKSSKFQPINRTNANSFKAHFILHSTQQKTDTVTEKSNALQVYNLDLSKAPKFKSKYLKLDETKKILLQTLIKKCSQFCHKHFATDTPDYRFANKVNFCLITLLVREQKIRIHIRTDGLLLKSSIIQVKKLPNHHYNGKEWVEIIISDDSQIDEAVRLIKQAYDFHL